MEATTRGHSPVRMSSVAAAVPRAVLGVGGVRMRNFIVLYFYKNTNNGLKSVMSTGTHHFGFLTHMAVLKD